MGTTVVPSDNDLLEWLHEHADHLDDPFSKGRVRAAADELERLIGIVLCLTRRWPDCNATNCGQPCAPAALRNPNQGREREDPVPLPTLAQVAGDARMSTPNPDSVRLPDLQESCDSLHYRIAEGATLGGEYDWHLGFVAGWNSAHRELAKLLGGTVTTKKLDERMRTVPCPDGHDDYVWEPQAKVMGTYRCACGHAQTCKRENAREAHRRHRRTLATSVLHAENDAARKAAQIDGSGSAS